MHLVECVGTATALAEGNMPTLFIVGTPIGNLEDITLRALRVLKEVGLIAAEDTRNTRRLLSHFDIHTRLISYNENNRVARTPRLLLELEEIGRASCRERV